MTGQSNRVRTEAEAAVWGKQVGRGFFESILAALDAEHDVWVFTTPEEIDADLDLSRAQKGEAKIELEKSDLGFVVWVREKGNGCSRAQRVFKTENGEGEVEFKWSGDHCAHYLPTQPFGWRERPDGARERVFYDIKRGWRPSTL